MATLISHLEAELDAVAESLRARHSAATEARVREGQMSALQLSLTAADASLRLVFAVAAAAALVSLTLRRQQQQQWRTHGCDDGSAAAASAAAVSVHPDSSSAKCRAHRAAGLRGSLPVCQRGPPRPAMVSARPRVEPTPRAAHLSPTPIRTAADRVRARCATRPAAAAVTDLHTLLGAVRLDPARRDGRDQRHLRVLRTFRVAHGQPV